MNFTAIDVETANPDLASVCQIGIVHFEAGQETRSWQTLINPEDYFDPFHTQIHGINEITISKSKAPLFRDIADPLSAQLSSKVVVSHTAFDRLALQRVFDKHRLILPTCSWLDSARVARRAWPAFSKSGYGLKNVAQNLGIEFKHHDAEHDARASGEILLRAIQVTGLSVEDWFIRVRRPLNGSFGDAIAREGNPEGPLFGHVVVFTGALSIPRKEAADLAAKAGCEVAETVNKRATLLVVGEQDIKNLAGHDKSSKHRKAEALIAAGQVIRILGENDFRRMVDL